jgi:DNA-binding CsgD family transcriptional regulator
MVRPGTLLGIVKRSEFSQNSLILPFSPVLTTSEISQNGLVLPFRRGTTFLTHADSADSTIRFLLPERQVLWMLSQGWNDKQIAGELEISPRAARDRVRKLVRKARVADSRQLVVFIAQQPGCLEKDRHCVPGLRSSKSPSSDSSSSSCFSR